MTQRSAQRAVSHTPGGTLRTTTRDTIVTPNENHDSRHYLQPYAQSSVPMASQDRYTATKTAFNVTLNTYPQATDDPTFRNSFRPHFSSSSCIMQTHQTYGLANHFDLTSIE